MTEAEILAQIKRLLDERKVDFGSLGWYVKMSDVRIVLNKVRDMLKGDRNG